MNSEILFIGSFLSSKYGSLSVSEKISSKLSEFGVKVELSSRFSNKVIRLLNIILSICFSKAKICHVEVYSGQAFIITEVASIIGNMLNKKVVLTLHGGALPDFYLRNKERIQEVFIRAYSITSPSRMLLEFFEDKGFKILYIPNSIELSDFPYDRSFIQPYSILWVRAFDKVYNPQIAVLALAKIKDKYPKATLTMVGPDKGVLEDVKQLINSYHLEPFVNITGPKSNSELYTYYQTHNIFLNTTSYESFGLAVMEAGACGIPIISSKVGEIPYLWTHEENILMVDELQPDLFAEAVIRIFESPELEKKLSLNARKRTKEFDWEHIKPQWIRLFS